MDRARTHFFTGGCNRGIDSAYWEVDEREGTDVFHDSRLYLVLDLA